MRFEVVRELTIRSRQIVDETSAGPAMAASKKIEVWVRVQLGEYSIGAENITCQRLTDGGGQ